MSNTIYHRGRLRNMLAWLRHMLRTAPPPQDAEAMLQVLKLSARVMQARHPEAAKQLEASADAFQRAVALTRQHADQPTNDELTAILSNARLDIQDQFTAQMDLSKAILTAVRGTEAAVGELRATFHRELSALGEQVSHNVGRLDDHAALLDKHGAAIQSFYESREASRQRHDQNDESRKRIEEKVDGVAGRLDAFIARIDALIASNPVPDDERDRILDFVRTLMAREAGDHAGG